MKNFSRLACCASRRGETGMKLTNKSKTCENYQLFDNVTMMANRVISRMTM